MGRSRGKDWCGRVWGTRGRDLKRNGGIEASRIYRRLMGIALGKNGGKPAAGVLLSLRDLRVRV